LLHSSRVASLAGTMSMSGTILIVDDDPEAVRTFADWLRLNEYEVRTASDGEAAWPHVQGVDAIILDARMPILDGLGFLRRLRADGEDIPVAIVTGDYLIDDAVLNEFRRLDAQIVFKPLWLDDLVALAAQLVNRATAA
jgi:two-component system response regulator MprA